MTPIGGPKSTDNKSKMFKETTIELVERAINEKIKTAKGYGDKYSSIFEAYGVLKEEVEEMKREVEGVEGNFAIFWNFIKMNNTELKLVESRKSSPRGTSSMCSM